MNGDGAGAPPEIVIVRRRGGDDAPAKGGAWKIAYADFVTALMAFFLVMWLINASNEETRAQVASYFNPIKLTDTSTGVRGLKDKKDKDSQAKEAQETAGGTPPAKSDVQHEAEVMANPDKMLEKIEAKLESATEAATVAAAVSDSSTGTGDPFDPRVWEKVPEAKPPAPAVSETENENKDLPDPLAGDANEKTMAKTAPHEVEESVAAAEPQHSDIGAGSNAENVENKQSENPSVTDGHAAEAAAISAAIAAKLGTGLEELPASVDVKVTGDGLLISLTDKQSFGMFKTGSAEPQPELVRLVEAIAGVLAGRPGYIVIRGHTDSRPYRNKKYDNWQLSTARAHLAQYMLVRGGLDERRIRRVEGVADREPRNAIDPQAPENRRIEILLGREGT